VVRAGGTNSVGVRAQGGEKGLAEGSFESRLRTGGLDTALAKEGKERKYLAGGIQYLSQPPPSKKELRVCVLVSRHQIFGRHQQRLIVDNEMQSATTGA